MIKLIKDTLLWAGACFLSMLLFTIVLMGFFVILGFSLEIGMELGSRFIGV